MKRPIVLITVRIYNRYNMGAILKIKYSSCFFCIYAYIYAENRRYERI